jgi:hypothetical protein
VPWIICVCASTALAFIPAHKTPATVFSEIAANALLAADLQAKNGNRDPVRWTKPMGEAQPTAVARSLYWPAVVILSWERSSARRRYSALLADLSDLFDQPIVKVLGGAANDPVPDQIIWRASNF